MRLLSFEYQGRKTWGWMTPQGEVIDGALATKHRHPSLKSVLQAQALPQLAALEPGSPRLPFESLRLLPVIPDPDKIFCIGLNYEEHRIETAREPTGEPTVFLRVASSQVAHGEAIVCPTESDELDYEGEIAVVIGRAGRRIAQADAWDYIAGYAPYNDASVRDWQRHSTQWTPGKNFDRTGGFGPWMVTRDEVPDGATLRLVTRLNGEVMQEATTEQLIFSIPRLLQYVSQFATLAPGDVIVTGTPGGVGFKRNPPRFMRPGDIAEVEIESLACLRNPVAGEP